MKEQFLEVDDLSNYQVSNYGYLVNVRTKRERKISRNQQGIGMVSVQDDHHRMRTFSISKLVADRFLWNDHDPTIFDSVINLDGDRTNAHVENLMWRPRWFAVKYHRQFQYPDFNLPYIPFMEERTGERFTNFREACTKYGLIFNHIMTSCDNGPGTFPTGQNFVWDR